MTVRVEPNSEHHDGPGRRCRSAVRRCRPPNLTTDARLAARAAPCIRAVPRGRDDHSAARARRGRQPPAGLRKRRQLRGAACAGAARVGARRPAAAAAHARGEGGDRGRRRRARQAGRGDERAEQGERGEDGPLAARAKANGALGAAEGGSQNAGGGGGGGGARAAAARAAAARAAAAARPDAPSRWSGAT